MTKIGQLSVGKYGFDVGFNHDVMRKYHGNFDLYANVDTSDNSDYVATLRIISEFKKVCNGLTLSEYCQERINSAEPNCTYTQLDQPEDSPKLPTKGYYKVKFHNHKQIQLMYFNGMNFEGFKSDIFIHDEIKIYQKIDVGNFL